MTTPHPSAVRAAQQLVWNGTEGTIDAAIRVNEAALLIDRETGVGELVAALEEAKFVLEFPVNARTSEALAKINQALTRYQQLSQPDKTSGREQGAK